MMRIVFMGTPDFAVPTLRALLDAGHEVAAVYTQPPRAAGRGLNARKSPVQVFAEAKHIPVKTPVRLKGDAEQSAFCDLKADAAVVVAYGLLLPRPILEVPRHGCFNVHASLLPRWRGAAPIQRAIMAGDPETGVSIMHMGEGLDTGPVCLAERVAISPEETAGELHDRLADVGARLIVEALADLEHGRLVCREQGDSATYAAKIENADARLDWSRPAVELYNQIRGLSPYPGAWFGAELNGKPERVKVLRAAVAKGTGPPGTVLDGNLTIACGTDALRLIEVQRAGKRAMKVEDFLRGAALSPGAKLG
jgi:methionyl-tRNA formyltransferase